MTSGGCGNEGSGGGDLSSCYSFCEIREECGMLDPPGGEALQECLAGCDDIVAQGDPFTLGQMEVFYECNEEPTCSDLEYCVEDAAMRLCFPELMDRSCDGDDVLVCGDTGVWEVVETCTGSMECSDGYCVEDGPNENCSCDCTCLPDYCGFHINRDCPSGTGCESCNVACDDTCTMGAMGCTGDSGFGSGSCW
jgi:hypothetical protein